MSSRKADSKPRAGGRPQAGLAKQRSAKAETAKPAAPAKGGPAKPPGSAKGGPAKPGGSKQAAARKAAARRQAVRQRVVVTVFILLVVGVVAGGVYLFRHNSSGGSLASVQTTPPPWDSGQAQLSERLQAIKLPALGAEGTVLHTHQHLDVLVDGKPVTVPAGIGIDANRTFLSPLHTHDDRGVIHVESDTVKTYTLGQFFDVWGVRLTDRCIGGLCASGSSQLRWWVNGQRRSGSPRKLALAAHQEIVIAFGDPALGPSKVPSTYKFQQGE